MIELPSLLLLIGTALIDSINPISIGVFILVITYLLGNSHSSKHLAAYGSAYILATWLAYLVFGLLLVLVFASLPSQLTGWLLLILGTGLMLVGLMEVKDYFWYGKWVSLRSPQSVVDKIHGLASTKTGALSLASLGLFVSVVSLPATGPPLLAVTGILRLDFSMTALVMMALFSLVLVLPLVIILILAVNSVKISHIARWKESSKAGIRLFTGLLMVFLSWLMIMTANGTINMG